MAVPLHGDGGIMGGRARYVPLPRNKIYSGKKRIGE